jgi:hypothetical protein
MEQDGRILQSAEMHVNHKFREMPNFLERRYSAGRNPRTDFPNALAMAGYRSGGTVRSPHS